MLGMRRSCCWTKPPALDSAEVEAAIQGSLYRLMQGKTVVAIAHRLSTIAAMDRLVVLDQGRIVEEGSHAEPAGTRRAVRPAVGAPAADFSAKMPTRQRRFPADALQAAPVAACRPAAQRHGRGLWQCG